MEFSTWSRVKSTPRSFSERGRDALLNGHQIGLHIDPNLKCNEDSGQAPPNHPKIRNYIIIPPYNGVSSFFHGKELLTEAQAIAIFEHGGSTDKLDFAPAILDKAALVFKPESYPARLRAVLESNTQISEDECRPSATKPRARSASGLEELLPENLHYRLAFYLKEARKQLKHNIEQYKDRFAPEATMRLIESFEDDLNAYIRAHDYDPQIMENFKAAIDFGGSTSALAALSLQEVLNVGIQHRSKEALRQEIKKMANPYSPVFEEAEHAMAQTVVDTLPANMITMIVNQKTPLLFFDDKNIGDSHYATGSYRNGLGAHQHFHCAAIPDRMFFSSTALGRNKLKRVIAHEAGHWRDHQSGTIFRESYSDRIPHMIEKDCTNIIETEAFIQTLNAQSPQEDIDKLQALLRKRLIHIAPEEEEAFKTDIMPFMEELKEALLKDIKHIKKRISVYTPEFRSPESFGYKTKESQHSEIPAIIHELEGKQGKLYIAALLPNLSWAVKEHRGPIYRAHRSTFRN